MGMYQKLEHLRCQTAPFLKAIGGPGGINIFFNTSIIVIQIEFSYIEVFISIFEGGYSINRL